jgi:hypothetical protein
MPTLTQTEIAAKEQELIAQGWTRQFTTFANRTQEYVDLYKNMGLEVRVEPWALVEQVDPSCRECALVGVMRTIFTRKQ